MKKILRLTLATVLSVTLAAGILVGCGKEKNPGATNTPVPEKSKVTVWGFGEEGNLLSDMKAGFEAANKDITVDVVSIPWDVADEKLTAAIAAKAGPDVIQMQTYTLMNYASAGALYNMKDLVAKYPELVLDNFFDAGAKSVVYEGNQIGVPWYVDATVLFYRTDILEEAGIKAPPATWDELKAAAKTLTERGKDMYGLGISPTNPVTGLAFVWQNGADMVVDGKAAANTQEFVDGLAFYKSFFTEGLAPKTTDIDLMQAFINGSIPMTLQEPWVLNALAEHPELDGKWATTTLPKNKNGNSYIGGCALTITNFTKNVDAAAKFVSYMSKPETQVEWHKLSKTLPANAKAWDSAVLKDNKALIAFGEQLKDGKTAPMVANFMGMVGKFAGTMEKVNIGNAEPSAASKELNDEITEMLKP